jgi:cytochrome c oxidase assembly protein subunit 15
VISSRLLGLAAALQFCLGLAALDLGQMAEFQGVIRTGHQTNGALLLAASVVLAFRAYRHLDREACAGKRAERPEAAALDWEAVA